MSAEFSCFNAFIPGMFKSSGESIVWEGGFSPGMFKSSGESIVWEGGFIPGMFKSSGGKYSLGRWVYPWHSRVLGKV